MCNLGGSIACDFRNSFVGVVHLGMMNSEVSKRCIVIVGKPRL